MESDIQEYLILLLAHERVLLPISMVRIVLAIPALKTIPDQDPAFKGLLNFHGTGIAVYELSKLIDPSLPFEITLDTPLVLTQISEGAMGILVSEVIDMVKIPNALLQTPLPDAMPFVKAIYENQNEAAWVLDLEKLVQYHRLRLKHEMSHE